MTTRIDVQKDFNAKGDGKNDDTAAFRHALEAVAGSGGVIEVPGGRYRLTDNLEIPANVTIVGTLSAPPCYKSIDSIPNSVSTLLADFPGGNDNGQAFLELHGPNSVVKGLAVCYPQQKDPAAIVKYPWTIGDREGGGSNNAVIDVFLLNSYQGVNFSNASPRHTIRRLTGQVLHHGIQIDRCTDVGRIVDVHFWPFWNAQEDAIQAMATSGVALILKGSDWQIVENFFAFGYGTGIRFDESDFPDPRTGEKKSSNGQISNLNLDSTGIGIDVNSIKPQGVHVSNANIALGKFADLYPSPRHALRGHAENAGSLVVRGLSVWGCYDEIVVWDSTGSLLLSSCVFGGQREDTEKVSAVKVSNGSACIQNNCFSSRFKAAVEFEAGATGVVSGNQLSGNMMIPAQSASGVVITDNIP